MHVIGGPARLDRRFERVAGVVLIAVDLEVLEPPVAGILDLNNIINKDADYKSLVFEWVQKTKANLLFTYNEEYNFDLKKSVFSTILYINKKEFGVGQGASKKEAEQEASRLAWEKIKDISFEYE